MLERVSRSRGKGRLPASPIASNSKISTHVRSRSSASSMVSSKPSSSKKAKVADSASKKVKGENFYHNAKTAGRLKMMKGGKPVYDRTGKMVQAAAFQKGEDEATSGRVQPDRRWFGTSWRPTISP